MQPMPHEMLSCFGDGITSLLCPSMPAHFLPPMAARAAAKMAASLAASSLRASSAGIRSNSALLVQRQRLGASAAAVHRAWGGVALQPLQFSSFSASASVSATDVAAIISDELKFEQESYEKPSLSPPAGWEINEKDGRSKVSLTRDFGDEVVQVDFTAREYGTDDYDEDADEEDDDADEDDEDEVALPESMTLEVCILKENQMQVLIFEVETDGESMDVLDVSLDKMKDESADEQDEPGDDQDSAYGGPVFSELDPKLQEAFTSYLEERGVNAELGQFIMDYSEDKEQREYMTWLKGVQNFLKQ